MSYANRGKAFEDMINLTNEAYQRKKIAFVEKRPTPIRILHPHKKGLYIACFDKKSSVDYSGICNGRSLYFEAKSVNNRTRFPLENIKDHQTDTLRTVTKQGGIAFFIIEFSIHKEVYLLTFEAAESWLAEAENGGRKSIPYTWFVESCNLVKQHKDIPLHYLEHLGVLV